MHSQFVALMTSDFGEATVVPKVVVLISYFKEAGTVAKAVGDFRRVLLTTAIFVFDDNSSDFTRDAARTAGPIVRAEARQGKGSVAHRMASEIVAALMIPTTFSCGFSSTCYSGRTSRIFCPAIAASVPPERQVFLCRGGGFELETELTLQALGGGSLLEVPSRCRERPLGHTTLLHEGRGLGGTPSEAAAQLVQLREPHAVLHSRTRAGCARSLLD